MWIFLQLRKREHLAWSLTDGHFEPRKDLSESVSVCCTTDVWTIAGLEMGAWGVEEAEGDVYC